MLPRVLVIEDDHDIAKYLKELLTENNYRVYLEEKGTLGLESFRKNNPDLVILDLTLPDVDGMVVCADIKRENPDTPVIILSARSSTDDKVKALEEGADDYITKPFVADELLARIKVKLRDGSLLTSKLVIADLELDPRKVIVKRGNKLIDLTPHEFRLLEYLMRNESSVLTRDEILNKVWGYSSDVETRIVDVYVGYLRKKIDTGFKKKLIRAVRGFGYSVKSE